MKRTSQTLVLLSAVVVYSSAADAQSAGEDIPVVKVRVEAGASRVTYRYRVVHSSITRLPPITGLELGLDLTAVDRGDSMLDVEPAVVSSPPGWSSEVAPLEEAELWELGWSGPDNGIMPGHQQCGFVVTLPRESDAYLKGPYTLYLSASQIGGVLEPDDSTAPCVSVAPTIRLTAPAEGATVSGVIDVAAEASDDVAVIGVYFTVDGEIVGEEVTAAPYSFRWDTSTVTAGRHVLGALARDADGNGARASVSVTVSRNQPPVARCRDLTLVAGSSCTASAGPASVDAGSSDPDGDALSLALSPSGPFGLGTQSVALTATDPGGLSSSCSSTIAVVDQTPPTLSCPANLVRGNDPGLCAATVDPGQPIVSDNCPGAVASGARGGGQAPIGSYPVGTTRLVWTARDTSGNTASCGQAVTVNDVEPPRISDVSLDQPILWPPNHKMVTVTVRYTAVDNCTPAPVCSLSVTSNETDGTTPEWQLIDSHHVSLRAERDGNGTGRIYAIGITCSDSAGNQSMNTATVTVPHDQRK